MIKKSCLNFFIGLSFIVWMAFFISQFINFQDANLISYVSAKLEFIINVSALIFAIKIYKKTSIVNKKIFIYLYFGLIGLFLNDLIFYYLIYFQHNYTARLSSLHFILNMLPFFFWAIAIIVFFYKILRITFQLKELFEIMLFFITLNATLIFLCFSSIHYANSTIAWQSMLQLTGYVIESVNFDLAILCLIYSKNKGLSWISSGFAVLISGDFLLTYTHLTQTDNTLGLHGELFWFLGLLFILFGILAINEKKENEISNWLRETHSIKHIFAFWTLRVSLISILPCFVLAYFFLPINKEVFLLLPSVLIVYSIILIIFSLAIGLHFETPFKQLEKNIDALILKKNKSLINPHFSIEEFVFLQNFLNQVVLTGEESDNAKQILIDSAAQAAHDIRSPLAAINTAISDVTSITEKKRIMIRNAAKRINDIANILLIQSKNMLSDSVENKIDTNNSSELIFVILENMIAEKIYEYSKINVNLNLNISNYSYNCFSFVNHNSLKRVLSNLINNSIDAINHNGIINLSLSCTTTHVEIIIEDNGCGIPVDILPKVTEQGFSFNNKNGSGIGLAFSKQYIESINGTMQIHSEEKIGTKVTINLVRSNPPLWFCDSMNIKYNSIIIILDDDHSIHDAWDERFTIFSQIQLIHFYSISELLKYKYIHQLPILYLIDYELLSDVKNGLDLIEELNINNNAVLVTSCFEDTTIQTRCQNINVKILPKSFVPFIKINEKNDDSSSRVLIDDNQMMRIAWKFAAEDAEINLNTYSSFEDFTKVMNTYRKNTIIYIDSDLGTNIKGEIYAKILFENDFTDIHLTTGHSKNQFNDMPWIKTIIGKEPPFEHVYESKP